MSAIPISGLLAMNSSNGTPDVHREITEASPYDRALLGKSVVKTSTLRPRRRGITDAKGPAHVDHRHAHRL
jgi:hypothetical protein